MTHDEKITWMALYCARHGLALVFNGECGFGRKCVGVTANGNYPEYEWYDEKTYERIDKNGDVWTPPDAYHKHTCVAVLGHGELSEAQLFDWLQWFDANDFALETGVKEADPALGAMGYLLGHHRFARMVKRDPPALPPAHDIPEGL